MAFDEVRINDQVAKASRGGPSFSTRVLAAPGGSEQRIAMWGSQRLTWDISYGMTDQATYEGILEFFYARQGRLRGFRFKDWTDYKIVAAKGLTLELTTTTFQIQKQYVNGGQTFNRKIIKPVTGTLTVYLNDGVTPDVSAMTIDYNTGVITYTGGPPGYVPRVAGQFDVPVRFDIDAMEADGLDNGRTIGPIPVVELKDGQ